MADITQKTWEIDEGESLYDLIDLGRYYSDRMKIILVQAINNIDEILKKYECIN